MGKLKIKFHPTFWIFIVFLLFSNNILSLTSYLACVFLHELGHSLMANFLGYKLKKITFLPFGASLSGKENVFYNHKHEILVAISGPLTNLILLIICLALFWSFPITYSFLDEFYFANLVTFLFNFLPVYPLDGGRVLYALIKKKNPIKKAYKKIKIIGVVVSVLLFVLFIISSFFKINFTIGLTSIFLLSGIFFEDTSSFYVTNFSFVNKLNKLNKGIESNVISVNENASLYSLLNKINKFKYNIVLVLQKNGGILKTITEQQLNDIFIAYPLDYTLKKIINKKI